jgi:hypothetical protein
VFLNGLTVLEIGDGVGGSFASSFLATLGASVTKVVKPSALVEDIEFDGAGDLARLQRRVLDRAKNVEPVDDLAGLLRDTLFDVVIVDRVVRAPDLIPSNIDDYLSCADANNRSVWVTLSAYGISGSRRHWYGSDLTISAASGVMTAVVDPATRGHLTLAGSQALQSAGQAVVVAALHALVGRIDRFTPMSQLKRRLSPLVPSLVVFRSCFTIERRRAPPVTAPPRGTFSAATDLFEFPRWNSISGPARLRRWGVRNSPSSTAPARFASNTPRRSLRSSTSGAELAQSWSARQSSRPRGFPRQRC